LQIQDATPIGRFPKEKTLSRQEYYSMGLFIASARKKYSSEKILISGPHNIGFHSQYIPALNSYGKWKGCWAGKTVLGIQSNGNVKGCLALPDNFIEGNIRERNIVDIWNDPNTFAYNRTFTTNDIGMNCRKCPYQETCKGGCLTRSNAVTGMSYNDPYCFYQIEQTMHL
jgi:radical SAM protein with 4Fe4S-binding SPASM domain